MLNIDRVSVYSDEKVLEVEDGDSFITLWIYLMPMKCAFKNGLNGKFLAYVFCNKKIQVVWFFPLYSFRKNDLSHLMLILELDCLSTNSFSGILIRVSLNLWINLKRIDIFTMKMNTVCPFI